MSLSQRVFTSQKNAEELNGRNPNENLWVFNGDEPVAYHATGSRRQPKIDCTPVSLIPLDPGKGHSVICASQTELGEDPDEFMDWSFRAPTKIGYDEFAQLVKSGGVKRPSRKYIGKRMGLGLEHQSAGYYVGSH